MNIPSYPKVYNLGHKELEQLFDGPVTVQEKVDGSQFSFGIVDGKLQMRSKGAEVHLGGDSMFKTAAEQVLQREELLTPGWIYRGEYLSKPKHNTLAYDRVPNGNIILFDIDMGDQDYIHPELMVAEVKRIGLEPVPLFGPMQWTPELIQEQMSEVSILGGSTVEGLVFKNYGQFGRDGKVLMGKHVSEKFKEVHRKDWKERNPGGQDMVDRIGQGLRTPARWNKAVQHLKERGELQVAPQDIGPLIKEVVADVKTEEEDAIKDALFKWAWPKIARITTAGVAEWYKGELLEQQFEEEKNGVEA